MVATPTLQEIVYNLGPAAGIPLGEGRAFRVRSTLVAVFRPRAGGIFATQAGCPHKDGPLADGILGDGKVICPLHAYSFDLSTGRPAGDSCEALKLYAVSLSAEGDMLLNLYE